MEIEALQSVNKVQPNQAGALNEGQSPFSSLNGEMGIFDLLFQQLLAPQALPEGAPQSETGLLPFSLEGGAFSLSDLGQSLEQGMFLSTDDLGAFLEQFNTQEASAVAIPTIFQQLQAAFDQASALGQNQVDLMPILSQATPTQGVELLDFFGQELTEGLNAGQNALRSFLEGWTGQGAENLDAEQSIDSMPTLKQALDSFLSSQSDSLHEALPHLSSQKGTAQNLLQQLFGDKIAPQNTAGQLNLLSANRGPESSLLNLDKANPLLQFTPEYLNPALQDGASEAVATQPLLTLSQEKPLFQTLLSSPATHESGVRLDQALLEALGLNGGATAESGNQGLRNSLQLNSGSQDQLKNSLESASQELAHAEAAPSSFDDNLERLQEVQAVIKQISKNVYLHRGMQETQISVKLQPEHLGNVSVDVRLQDGSVNVKIMTESSQVRDLLSSNLTALKNSLENSDIKIDRLQVFSQDMAQSDLSEGRAFEDGTLERQDGGSQASSAPFSLNLDEFGSFDVGDEASSELAAKLYRVNYLA